MPGFVGRAAAASASDRIRGIQEHLGEPDRRVAVGHRVVDAEHDARARRGDTRHDEQLPERPVGRERRDDEVRAERLEPREPVDGFDDAHVMREVGCHRLPDERPSVAPHALAQPLRAGNAFGER